jgi:hypothetical protein
VRIPRTTQIFTSAIIAMSLPGIGCAFVSRHSSGGLE